MEKQRIHGSCVEYDGQSVLIIGDSGSGKSSVSLALIALGATLVSDDAVDLTRKDDKIMTSPPDSILGQIEARSFGILEMPYSASATLKFVVDMNKSEVRRLPEDKTIALLGLKLPLVFGGNNLHLANAVFCVLKLG
ncbi:MAG: HPr kinase/phosphatase C-terminal domain-containing protein [Rhodobacteraceae bacterium]|nr:HPr kinase/phosphatase C-terminal domain-containing protein [Paracoccaceae bacterium]